MSAEETKIKNYMKLEGDKLYFDTGYSTQVIGAIKTRVKNYYSKTDLANQLLVFQPLYYDPSKIWWAWNREEYKWYIVDEVDILNFVKFLSDANTVNSKEKAEIIEALKQQSRMRKPKETSKNWVQFKDTIVDIMTGEEIRATPKYFVTNPIPYKLHKERFEATPVMDRIFTEWVGEKNIKKLYQIIAYCLLTDYPLHRIFCFIGAGMNGKSKYLELVRKFIGENNVCSTELDTLLTSRFELFRLYKKLVCQMGETNFNEINKTSILKKLSGGDLIGYEKKRADPFEDINYAKILISTNTLPTTSDKTIGFYRRWMIIDFLNQFSEKKDILSDIPEEEFECLAVKCLGIIYNLLKEREFDNEGSIDERMRRYEEKSDPLEKFIKEYCTENYDGYIWKGEFEKKLNEWCKENRFRELSSVAIGKKMKEKGIEQAQKYEDWMSEYGRKGGRAWIGITFKGNSNKINKINN